MNVVIPMKALRDAVATVCPVAPSKPSQRALSCVYINAQDSITIRATDLMTFVRANVEGDVMKPGSVLVEARALNDIVRVLPASAATVTLERERGSTKLAILAGNARHRIETIPTEEYPEWPAVESVTGRVSGEAFRRAIQTVEHGAYIGEGRPHLAGVKLESDGKALALVTTDGHRLAKASLACSATIDALVPIKAASMLARAVDDVDVEIGVHGGQYLVVEIADRQLIIRVLDQVFPPWSRVIPEPSKRRVTVLREALIAALRGVELAARKKVKDTGVVSSVAITFRDGKILVEGQNDAGAEAVDEVPCDHAGKDFSFGVNAIYLLDTLGAMVADEVVLDIGDEMDPLRIDPVVADGSSFIVMPMRLV